MTPTAAVPVSVSHGQYHLQGLDAELGEPPFAGGNGLVWVNPAGDAAVIMTGITDGELPVHTAALDREPSPDLDSWDEVVEVSLTLPGDRLWILGPTDIGGSGHVPLPADPGETRTYRVRVHARGRDEGSVVQYLDPGDEPCEEHQILLWPAPPPAEPAAEPAPEAVLKQTDDVGAEIRSRAPGSVPWA